MVRKLGPSLALLLVIAAAYVLPLSEFVSWTEFRFFPTYAKESHFVRLTHAWSGQVVYLLGTVHDGHFQEDGKYPYRDLRSVLKFVKPDLLLVEIRPESLNDDLWGEGPPEMPYAVAVARAAGIPVQGMDFWANSNTHKDFDDREDHMADLIVKSSSDRAVTLIFTGYSHVSGLTRRLKNYGFDVDSFFTNDQKLAALSLHESDVIPRSYFEAVGKVVDRVSRHLSDYPEEWAEKRRGLLRSLESKAER